MNNMINPLPVASLRDVLKQYLTAMAPISTPSDLAQIRSEADAFFEKDGPILQECLEHYAKELNGESWLREYSRQRFLSLRTPLTVVGNFTLELMTPQWMHKRSAAQNAATLAFSVAELYKRIQKKEIGVPNGDSASVFSEQICGVLGGERIPRQKTDDYLVTSADQIRDFGLFYRNHYYLIELFHPDGSTVSIGAIYAAIHRILSQSPEPLEINFNTSAYGGSGRCAQFLDSITQNEANRANMKKIERALFHLAIKDEKRSGIPFEKLLYGDTTDLWPYKPWSFTLYADGALTVNNEHTAADGVTNAFLYENLFSIITDDLLKTESNDPCRYTELETVLSKGARAELLTIKDEYSKMVCSIRVAQWRRSGIRWDILRQNGIGRDALIQTAFCYAGEKVYHMPRCIHESVSTAQYHQGRTSCLRPVSSEMQAAARTIDGKDDDDKLLLNALIASTQTHNERIRNAKENVCFVRHGAGLQQMVSLFGEKIGVPEMPEIFRSEGYRRFCSQEISTSTIGSGAVVKCFAFSPQVPDGLGIGYLSESTGMSFTVTWNENELYNGREFLQAMDDFFDRIQTLQERI